MTPSITYFSTPMQKETTSTPLLVNGKEITSLQVLLSKTKPEELYPLLHDHSLLHWLILQGHAPIAYSLAQLLRTGNFTMEFRRIIGFPEEYNQELCEAELKNYEIRKNCIRRFTNDEGILSAPYSVAFNQTELDEILFLGAKTIYLCQDVFKIPLEITSVHYIGLGGAVIRQPLSQKEYAEHNIVITGIPLPEVSSITANYPNATSVVNKQPEHSKIGSIYTNLKLPHFLSKKSFQ